MGRSCKNICLGLCIVAAGLCVVYYCWSVMFSTGGNWEMTQYPKEEEDSADLQYFSPSMNVYYGKKLSVNPAILKKLNLNRDRDDFVNVTDKDSHKYVLVTGTDSWHYGGEFALISSIHQFIKRPRIIVYDLGMTEAEIDELKGACGVTVRRFKFEEYPDHVRKLNYYSFKPLIVHEVLNEWPSVVWLDASVRLKTGYVEPMLVTARHTDGLVMFAPTPYSTYSVTHPNMYQYLPTDLRQVQETHQREAGLVMYYRTRSVYRNIIYWWVLCALDPKCMAPSRFGICAWGLLNVMDYLYCHKYDQSSINILVGNHYKFNLTLLKPKHAVFKFVNHGPKEGALRYC